MTDYRNNRERRRTNAKHDRHSYVRITACAGVGKGLVAIEYLSRGTYILSEEPIITIPCDKQASAQLLVFICQQGDALSEHQRRPFLSMPNIYAYGNATEQYLGIIGTKGLPLATNESEGG